jgi:hypothetical protein
MASMVPGDIVSGVTAENDLSAKQYYILEWGTAAGQVDVCDGTGDAPIGVLQNKPRATEYASYMINGTSKVVSGAAVSIGDTVGTDASGKAVAKTADAALIIGVAKTASGGDGEIIEVQLGIRQRAS